MSTSAIFAAAFHDTPGLLAVRLRHPGQGAVALAFATQRRPDVASGCSSVGGIGGLIAGGIIIGALVLGNAGGCSGGGDAPAALPLPTISSPQARDAAESSAWPERAANLGDDLAPRRPALRPWAVRALLDVPRELARGGLATGGWLQPACSAEDRLANARGRRLAAELFAGGVAGETAVILDLPGAQAVAAAAGLAAAFEPVFTSDCLPHPQGVVPSAQTLAAALYWRPQLMAARGELPQPCFILEGDRLAPYANQADRFDNRARARLPGAAALRDLGVKRVLYVRPHRGAVAEADDLNELFTAYAAAELDVRHLGLDSIDEPTAQPTASTTSSGHSWLWLRTGWNQLGTSPAGNPDPDAAYQAVRRPVPPLAAFDGGAAAHSAVLERLRPQPTPSAPSSGGSWFRSSSSHYGG